MRAFAVAGLCCVLAGLAGCAAGNKFLDPRSDLDRKIYYVERDGRGASHPISNASLSDRAVTRVPMPALVDINSTIQVGIAKSQLADEKTRTALTTQLDTLLKRKQAVAKSVDALTEVVRVRTVALQKFSQSKDLQDFLAARDAADKAEFEFRKELTRLWPSSNAEAHNAMTQAYFADRASGNFRRLQDFLAGEIAAIEAAHRELERQLKSRQATLALEAFLISPGKQPAAIHLDGYDSIKAESLVRRDPLGLDLSPEERASLEAHLKATRELAESLERLRRGEQTLNDTLRNLAAQMAPQIGDLVSRGEALAARLSSEELRRRAGKTEELFKAFLKEAEARNRDFVAKKRAQWQTEKEDLIGGLPKQVGAFQKALDEWIKTGRQLKGDWEKANPSTLTPELLLGLINKTVDASKAFRDLLEALPKVAATIEQRTSSLLETWLAELAADQRNLILYSPQTQDLRADLDAYAADLKQVAAFVREVYVTLAGLLNPVAQMPPTASSTLDIPLDRIKDTFINLEQTPRLAGDTVTLRATFKSGDQVDTSIATFRVEKFGHYAELSPAVVLAKPKEIAGTDDGFRFAPTLSWMYHYTPRPEETGRTAGFFRTMAPSVGLHSAFLNFNSPSSGSSAQIGLGATLGFWKNRLQFGYGWNLMAKSADEGRNYYFVGSDLIGLLQALGLAKPQ